MDSIIMLRIYLIIMLPVSPIPFWLKMLWRTFSHIWANCSQTSVKHLRKGSRQSQGTDSTDG